ncbi:transglycosylase SLT domain-containing protein [Altererythrobacter salegens]|uniref:Transglycosylase SLT domain-containing protein n=1 Tax=Croceibacterium salegens TaxID=1737568 RepID=A0A6I4STH2_9SPHN|nr:lytic transglycosylase domain-containing protein [Croceibacterium salegens]MXO59205.1 transglycosylase SLT domain-containing protein [Croceibacterium salegens]
MSSMVRRLTIATLLCTSTTLAAPVHAQDAVYEASDWDRARADLVAKGPGRMAPAIGQWEQLKANKNLPFDTYASFLLTYPGFPDAGTLQGYAEEALKSQFVATDRLAAFFDRYPPISNYARAHYALALMAQRPSDAPAVALAAWRGGEMSDTAEAAISANFGSRFTQDDQDARMDALLWQRDVTGAARQFTRTSPSKQGLFAARLSILQGGDGATTDPAAMSDPGYLYNRSRELRTEGRAREAVSLLSTRRPLAARPFDPTSWVTEQLSVARMGGAQAARDIASKIDDAFAPGADVSVMEYKLRDDYTSLVWLGGTQALWNLGDAAGAVPLFYRYGNAARTPQTRSKGFFWAGHAAQRAGQADEAKRYYEMAAAYPDRFYGQLALSRLGRSMPAMSGAPSGSPSAAERQAFTSAPLTAAVTEVARDAPWSVGIRFYREMAAQADSLGDYLLVTELARDIGRRDLAVIAADAAAADGLQGFTTLGYPTLVTPPGTNWTLVHAITRQESQFAQNAISHAGARGLMQLMPGTAREEAGKAGIQYMSASLVDDASYNMRLGSNYIDRMLSYYDGSYPLAIAAYNAGPGNVNKWLAANGDPRRGSISWIDWIEKIPIYETKNYVQRVLENAVVYESLHPEKAPYGDARTLDSLLR